MLTTCAFCLKNNEEIVEKAFFMNVTKKLIKNFAKKSFSVFKVASFGNISP